ncbi:hypothetical protein PUH89_17105 [Rhodobacter capsulatus]|uniref:Lipoprotein n=1 Tax=Rhodobacter capsulatus TaxID=1061 RepID=A0A1G7BWN3_RHOCA|nr:hypothetical protein [Rhodobacter capsulatus]WER09000.1 hypothetical protein PUH89_17105 [Rhodobacter capsulatus]SDE31467.1 hypothetical protein SAMN04244550_00093 [Rhodobacter capsulatus]
MRIALPLLLILLAACAGPRANVHANPAGQVTTGVSTGVGPMRLGVNSNGRGTVGTRLGWLHLGMGL